MPNAGQSVKPQGTFRFVGAAFLAAVTTGLCIAEIDTQLVCAQSPNQPAVALSQLSRDPASMAKELARLDQICGRLGLSAEQDFMRHWQLQEPTDSHLLFLPIAQDPLMIDSLRHAKPRKAGGGKSGSTSTTAMSTATSAARANWLKHFVAARQQHARYWFEEAKRNAAAGDEWAAYNCLWRTLREDDAHAEAKRVLGTLLSALAIRTQPRISGAAHPIFQWAPGSFSRMESANFKITSHTDAETTRAIAEQLEQFYALWTQVFYPLWAPPNITTARLEGRNPAWSRRKSFDVVICKDRNDYLKVLGVSEENIGVSVGYYNPETQTSFFYPDEQLNVTLYHEITHQLLAEGSQLSKNALVGSEHDFWMVEGIALYMESLADRGHHWRLGGWIAPRMQASRYRALHDGQWTDWDEFSADGMEAWKTDPEISKRYTHAAGLSHFFLDKRLPPEAPTEGEDQKRPSPAGPRVIDDAAESAAAADEQLSRYDVDASRAAFYSALVAVYQGDRPSTQLKELLGGDEAQRSYVHFMLVRDRHLASAEQMQASTHGEVAATSELVLARSQLTRASWELVGHLKDLEWLDVSFSNATSRDLGWLTDLQQLERLSLEGTAIDSTTLELIGKLPRLKELDLSYCPIDDAALVSLGKPEALETLWLSGTKIGSPSTAVIEALPKLNFVALNETQFAQSEVEQLTKRIESRKKK